MPNDSHLSFGVQTAEIVVLLQTQCLPTVHLYPAVDAIISFRDAVITGGMPGGMSSPPAPRPPTAATPAATPVVRLPFCCRSRWLAGLVSVAYQARLLESTARQTDCRKVCEGVSCKHGKRQVCAAGELVSDLLECSSKQWALGCSSWAAKAAFVSCCLLGCCTGANCYLTSVPMFPDWATFTGLQAGMLGGATGNMWVAVVEGGMRVSCLSGRSLLIPFLFAKRRPT